MKFQARDSERGAAPWWTLLRTMSSHPMGRAQMGVKGDRVPVFKRWLNH